MAFPDIHAFSTSDPGPYELQMGSTITALLQVFVGRVPDAESNERVLELASHQSRWSAGHAVFDEVRCRLLAATEAKDELRASQYSFEEVCCKAIYNATEPQDPFDPCSAFYIAVNAIDLARAVGLPVERIIAELVSRPGPVE